jgi:hypothetical protein
MEDEFDEFSSLVSFNAKFLACSSILELRREGINPPEFSPF